MPTVGDPAGAVLSVACVLTLTAPAVLVCGNCVNVVQELFSRIRKDLLREMKALKPGDR